MHVTKASGLFVHSREKVYDKGKKYSRTENANICPRCH